MSAVVIEETVRVPDWVKNLESFRRWYLSDDFPNSGVISYIQKEVWLDLRMEELAHNQVKGEIAFVLTGLLKKNQLGKYFQDRFRLINWQAGLSTEPDGMFVLYETLQNDQAKLVEGEKGWMELEGTPDMVLEVVSSSSVKKDTVKLRKSYWQAEIPEYWLVDARQDPLSFEILRSNSRGYVPARKSGGWQSSSVFSQDFKLQKGTDKLGYPEFTLSVR
jgi:Uma2 family endonuclease